jgi:hypothetical protein
MYVGHHPTSAELPGAGWPDEFVKKIARNVAQPLLPKFMHILNWEKVAPK